MTGRESNDISLSSLFSLEDINKYFKDINTDTEYVAPTPVVIPEDTRIPRIDEYTALKFLSNVKKTAPGPDQLLHWFWRDYALELAPAIAHIFNLSIESQAVPQLWKLANILSLPKESPLTCINQLRPISLTDIIIRLFERIIYQTGCNTTLALLKNQHTWLKWLDKKADTVRVLPLISQRPLIQ